MQTEHRHIALANRQSLHEARGLADDWSGKTDAKTRRKLQNRLHQRAWRRRTAMLAKPNQCHVDGNVVEAREIVLPSMVGQVSAAFAEAHAAVVGRRPGPEPQLPGELCAPHKHDIIAEEMSARNHHPMSTQSIDHTPALLIPPVLPYGSTGGINFTPSNFPLSADHYLLTLVQYNVLRAQFTNMALCSRLWAIPIECQESAALIATLPTPATPPPAFVPTPLQTSTPHKAWIDCFPCPQMRDNLIRADLQKFLNEDDLCNDTCGGLYEGYADCDRRGVLVWGEPWLISSWEISEGFLAKWGWLLKGCREMLESTNRWRESRGEDCLVVELE